MSSGREIVVEHDGMQLDQSLPAIQATHPPADSDVMSLMQRAVDRNVPVEMLERLVDLHERIMARNAEQAMAEALAAFQAECPPIPRIATASVMKNGVKQYEYHFAPLEEIVRVIRPYLTKHGLSYTHNGVLTPKGETETTCVLQHVMGATRSATFTGPPDQSGGKNALQAVGSARSYGRRYTLMDVLGLTTEDDDDGGAAGSDGNGDGAITAQQAADLSSLIDEVGVNKARFLDFMGCDRVADIAASDYARAVRFLEKKRDK